REPGPNAPLPVEPDQRPALAWLDARHSRRTVRRDPEPLLRAIPGDRERGQPFGQGRQRAAAFATGEDLPVENARHPDRPAVAGNAFDDAVLRVDRDYGLRLYGHRCG